MKRALVTGATGFIGSRLVAHLLAEGWTVAALVRPASDAAQLPSGVAKIVYDGDFASMAVAVDAASPDVTFHLASLFRAEHKAAEITDMVAANITLGTHLVDALTANDKSALMVNAGTAWQHLGNAAYSPVCLYAATKAAFEDLLQFYVEARGLRVTTLKIFDTYGRGDPRRKLVPIMVSRLLSGEDVQLTSGEEILDFMHVDDVVSAFIHAARRMLSGSTKGHERFALPGGEPLSIRQLASLLETISGKTLNAKWGAFPSRKREMRVPWSGGVTLPDWSPSIRLADGLKSLIGT